MPEDTTEHYGPMPPNRRKRAERERATNYVYEVYDRFGDPLYVGCSVDFLARLNSHRTTAPWWDRACSIQIRAFDDRIRAHAYEQAMIRDLRPEFNQQSNPDHYAARRRARAGT